MKPIKDYDGYYVTELGTVGSEKSNKGLKPRCIRNYMSVRLYKDGVGKEHKIHRLVAESFIPNPNNLPCVNHKDEDKTNNGVSNLEGCTEDYNYHYGTRIQRVAASNTNGIRAKLVRQLLLDGTFVKLGPSTKEIDRSLGFHHTHIVDCCNGKAKTAYGYKGEYAH